MNIGITKSFLESAFLLDKKVRKYTMDAVSQLETNPKSPALNCHRVNKAKCDPSFWSARVNDDVRIIYSQVGELKTLIYVDHHEDAYHWCEGKYLRTTNFGATMIYDERQVALAEEKMAAPARYQQTEKPLLEARGVKKKQLIKIGITEVHADNLMKITDEDLYLDYIQIYPEEIQEALMDLETGGRTFDEIYNDLVDDEFQQGHSTEQKDTKRRVHLLQDLKELEQILEQDDFEQWTIFLHPDQEKLVRRDFRGPALVEGGPGTGKTVVGMHRAVHLATEVYPQGRVLICTFSRKLARYIEEKLEWLKLSKNLSCNNIDVNGIDAQILAIYREAYGKRPELATAANLRELIQNLYQNSPPSSGSLDFYTYEYFEVIERQHIQTLSQYLSCDRSGSGGPPLTARQREKAWEFLHHILDTMSDRGMLSFVDLAHEAAAALRQGRVQRKYQAIIIDEAQDLEPIKLEVMQLYADGEENSLFILSDANQRIFRLHSWKKDAKIDIVGRTYYLSVNYRTTRQIGEYARNQFMQSEMVKGHIRDYKSIINGELPIVRGFRDLKGQQQYILEEIQALSTSIPPEEICIVCPRMSDCTGLSTLLSFHDLPNQILKDDLLPEPGKGFNLCTIRGVKGLEFRVIFLYDYTNIEKQCLDEAGSLKSVEKEYIRMSDCEKYVATTRARDLLYITYTEEEEGDA